MSVDQLLLIGLNRTRTKSVLSDLLIYTPHLMFKSSLRPLQQAFRTASTASPSVRCMHAPAFPVLLARPLSKPLARPFATPLARPFARRAVDRPHWRGVSTHTQPQPVIPKSLPIWLFGCSGLVFGIIIIGGLTRLTESGLSITEWEPITGILPPITDQEWAVEWDKYKVSPEGIMWVIAQSRADSRTNANIEMSEFKKIFYMEWAHRVAGRILGVA